MDTESVAAAEETLPASGRRRPRRGLTHACAALALVALAGLLVGLHVRAYTKFSPIDEPQHLDYLIKASHGDLVRSGEKLSQEVLREETCRRLDSDFDPKVPPCVTKHSTNLDPVLFQEEGYDTAFIHPPTYYAVSGWIARAGLAVLPGNHDIMTVARLTGAMWLGLGAVLLLFALLELGANVLAATSVTALVISAPTVLHASATVNPDATAVVAGAAMLLAGLKWERGRVHWLVPALVAGAIVALKATNALAVGVVLVYLAARWWTTRDAPSVTAESVSSEDGEVITAPATRPLVRMEVATLAAVAVVALAWMIVSSRIQILSPHVQPQYLRFRVDDFPFRDMAAAWRVAVSPLQSPQIPKAFDDAWFTTPSGFVDLALVAGCVCTLVLAGRRARVWLIAAAALGLGVIAGPALVIFNYVAQGISVGAPARYALSLVPALAAGCLRPLRSRAASIAIAVAAGVVVLGTTWTLAAA